MGSHINKDGQFQSDNYPTCPAGKVPLSVNDETAQDLLWDYAQRRRAVDGGFADDLEQALLAAGFVPPVQRFNCKECGFGVGSDSDGCCAACGTDLEVWERIHAPPADEGGEDGKG